MFFNPEFIVISSYYKWENGKFQDDENMTFFFHFVDKICCYHIHINFKEEMEWLE